MKEAAGEDVTFVFSCQVCPQVHDQLMQSEGSLAARQPILLALPLVVMRLFLHQKPWVSLL